ncbi:PEP/pyruvate-binding domain-containing protein [Pseudodesulfovibrio senegalensis]|jgi:pyruvate,water dikinase|uniref:Phosphoenolpyruvate synthase n=1 Tax=Pseudodesulfovibrio senegalensis TaxID=1721087 RepID=A0A6N6N538_9BACT|nr:PEP/pyruvate-binding domain-containing protein [Pseudodesulfovibrio senegalensis]KAB1442898.1 pyruvate, water dikinase [Pseudodesulfovibrio senegalensis]
MGFLDWLPFFGKKTETDSCADAQQYRDLLAARYHHFKLLLSADGENHEIITDIEEALRGERLYGMHFVRATCTRSITAVFQMIRHLNELAPGKYETLFERFDEIRAEIEPHIAHRDVERGGPLVMDLAAIDMDNAHQCGSKMASLAEAGRALGLAVPPGFVVTAEGFRLFMAENELDREIERILQAMDKDDPDEVNRSMSRIMQMVMDAPLPEALETAILEAHDALLSADGAHPKLALRSSALGEDGQKTSFAGQHRSVLNVTRDSLLHAYREVLASKYSTQARAYRLTRGIRDEDVAMCVGCMVMVDAHCGGVAYSGNPVNPDDDTVSIHSVWGLPKGVVDGSAETDMFRVSRSTLEIVKSTVAAKPEKYVCRPGEGTCRVDNVDQEDTASLTPEQAKEVARAAIRIQDHFGWPQDIEWAVDTDGKLFLLQCRPLQIRQESDDDKSQFSSPTSPPIAQGGVTASGGVAAGPAFVVRKEADVLSFPDNAVLVLAAALPRRASLLHRASAVVTERGGVAGHLANVAREFGIPALFGVRNITGNLQNGDEITVDADMHTVYPGRIESLLKRRSGPKSLMRGSPVQAALAKAARHIIRLRLLDPDSPDFRPRNCKTMHDIVRFCHETAVREMFDFGIGASYQKASCRQLICDVPKQFWVLNLEDGFDNDGQQRNDSCIMISQIESVPMRALWDGMTAVPWDGPPPVNARGFLSVMFEATMNPNLNADRPSDMAMKNYFIISKNFCSLQSRFGFHFCGAEALVGERPGENYARFHFKGGAANLDRRIRRARFIKEILEEYDFRVKLRQDNLRARIEGFGPATMVHRLRVLGYMIIHTRQLDMIMADTETVNRLRERIHTDLANIETEPGDASGTADGEKA